MKRDLDLFRALLLQVEATDYDRKDSFSNRSPWRVFSYPDAEQKTVIYHVRLLLEQGFLCNELTNLKAQDQAGTPAAKYLPDALTNAGHEFLESVRDPEVWKKTKEGVNKLGSSGIDLIMELGKGFLKTKIKQHTGLEVGD